MLYGPHTLDAYIQEFSRASIPFTTPLPTPVLLLHHQSKLHRNYAPEGSCVIKLASLTLDVKDFETEVLWDTVVVNCRIYSGSTGPVGVEADGEISCFQMKLVEKGLPSLCMST